LVPWANGKFLVWDATCTDTYCASNIIRTCLEPGRAAAHAESEKMRTYSHLCRSYCFVPVGVETRGVIGSTSPGIP
jgi:predicted kinase